MHANVGFSIEDSTWVLATFMFSGFVFMFVAAYVAPIMTKKFGARSLAILSAVPLILIWISMRAMLNLDHQGATDVEVMEGKGSLALNGDRSFRRRFDGIEGIGSFDGVVNSAASGMGSAIEVVGNGSADTNLNTNSGSNSDNTDSLIRKTQSPKQQNTNQVEQVNHDQSETDRNTGAAAGRSLLGIERSVESNMMSLAEKGIFDSGIFALKADPEVETAEKKESESESGESESSESGESDEKSSESKSLESKAGKSESVEKQIKRLQPYILLAILAGVGGITSPNIKGILLNVNPSDLRGTV
jgi:hypothetical protein